MKSDYQGLQSNLLGDFKLPEDPFEKASYDLSLANVDVEV